MLTPGRSAATPLGVHASVEDDDHIDVMNRTHIGATGQAAGGDHLDHIGSVLQGADDGRPILPGLENL
jgi:hypothetical protein